MHATTLPLVTGFCRGLAIGLAVLVVALASSAHAETWRRAVAADDVAITVHVLTIEELKRKSGTRTNRDLHASAYGWSVLYRTPAGELRCNVYVTADATEATLEHERRHCHGWVHP